MRSSIVNWDKPTKIRSTEEHNKMYSSDCEADGTYVPNMSKEDQDSWKGKIINRGKTTARAELRKTFSDEWQGIYHYAQVLIILDRKGMKISTNGSMVMSHSELALMNCAIDEARLMIRIVK